MLFFLDWKSCILFYSIHDSICPVMRAWGYYVSEVILYIVGSNKRSCSFIINICFGIGWTQYYYYCCCFCSCFCCCAKHHGGSRKERNVMLLSLTNSECNCWNNIFNNNAGKLRKRSISDCYSQTFWLISLTNSFSTQRWQP